MDYVFTSTDGYFCPILTEIEIIIFLKVSVCNVFGKYGVTSLALRVDEKASNIRLCSYVIFVDS